MAGMEPVELLDCIDLNGYPRAPGTLVVASADDEADTATLVRYLARTKALPATVLLVRLRTELVPHVPLAEQLDLATPGNVDGLHVVTVRLGYADDVDLPGALAAHASTRAFAVDALYCVSAQPFAIDSDARMAAWRRWLFSTVTRRCAPTAEYLRLPLDRTLALP
jgi:K+ transporter